MINPPLPSISAFSEDQSAELRDRIFDEFNSLAVVYQQPSSSFVRQADPGELLDNALVRFRAISHTPGCRTLRLGIACALGSHTLRVPDMPLRTAAYLHEWQ